MDFIHNSYIILQNKIPQSDPQPGEVQLSEKKKNETVKMKTTGASWNYVVSTHWETMHPKAIWAKMIDLSKSTVKLLEPYKRPTKYN